MTTLPRDGDRRVTRLRRSDRTTGEGGFALVWFGLVLVVLMAMAGAAIDVWSWWYQGGQNQRAADAAALGGVVFMPEDSSSARATARDIAEANGVDVSELTIETSADDPSLLENQLRVTVANDVRTRFLQLIGVDVANISRDAVAEYTSRLPMGSPEQYLGNDPDRGFDPGFWLSVSGRNESKVGGDRYQNFPCGQSTVQNCLSGNNAEYRPEGYAFAIELQSAPTGPLVIEAYDPVFTPSGGSQSCGDTNQLNVADYNANRAAIRAAVVALFPGETQAQTDARYAPGDTIFCPGEDGNSNTYFNPSDTNQNVLTFVVREPDNTPSNDFDNDPVDVPGAPALPANPDAGCTRQFRSVDLSPGGSTNRKIYSVLNPTDFPTIPADVAESVYALRNYRRWVPICTIPAGTVQSWYASGLRSVMVQVRSNADLTTPYAASTSPRNGRNHFALRAGYGTATTTSGVSIYAQGKLPLHNGARGNSTTEFFVTRVPPGNAGRTLSLDFHDIADASGTVQFQIVPPAGNNFTSCTFRRFQGDNNGNNVDVGLAGATVSGCTISGMTNSNYNGRLVEARIRVPTTYSCNVAVLTDCWIKVRVTYNAGAGTVTDHTTWDAGVVGEPVRLVE